MAYTSQELIINAYYLSGIVSRDLEMVDGSQISDGLFRLNGLLAMKAVDTGQIPYFTEFKFPAIVGQETYFIPNLVSAQTMTFNIGSVRYSMRNISREEYFSSSRAEDILALPFLWHLERLKDGSNIYMYPNPQQAYEMTLWGKFSLASTELNQDLETIYDPFYLEYLLHLLAKELCEFFNVMPSMSIIQKLKELEQVTRDVSPMDFTMRKIGYFTGKSAASYGTANLATSGFAPSNY